VNSILAQQGVNVTLFVSVDLSTDGTENWVLELAEKHSNVLMLPYGERFGGAGPNFFRLVRDVDFSGFDAVSFADQDDIWLADKLQRAYALLQARQCDVYSSNVTAFWPDGKQVLIDKAQPQKKFDHFFEAAGPGCTYVFNVASALAFKRFVVEIGDRINTVSLHDWLTYAFCRHNGFTWFIDTKPSMLYRQHGGNQVGTNTGLDAFRKRIEMVGKHWYRNQASLILELVAPEKRADFNKYVFRVFNFYSMRRRTRDAFALLVMCVLGVY
jgi:rhamnosyltransferase